MSGSAQTGSRSARYHGAAIGLHWLLAGLILTQFALALYMGALPEDTPAQDAVQATHVSLGITILVLTLTRIGVRLACPPPPLPAQIEGWMRGVARASHAGFYLLMLAIPLTGWALQSFFPKPIPVWGVSVWPPLPGLGGLPREQGEPLYGQVESLHGMLAWALIGLVALHVLAALKHQFDGAPVLWRMAPLRTGDKPPPPDA